MYVKKDFMFLKMYLIKIVFVWLYLGLYEIWSKYIFKSDNKSKQYAHMCKSNCCNSVVCTNRNTAANIFIARIITWCNFMLITHWLKKQRMPFPHSAPLLASHQHPIIHDLTVHLLAPLPPPIHTVSERAITTQAEYKRPLTVAFGSRGNAQPERSWKHRLQWGRRAWKALLVIIW